MTDKQVCINSYKSNLGVELFIDSNTIKITSDTSNMVIFRTYNSEGKLLSIVDNMNKHY